MKNPKLLYLLALLLVFLASCYPAYYPTKPNTPLLGGKGEGSASLAIGPSSYEGQAAYAITEGLAFGISGCRVLYSSESPVQQTSGWQFDIGPGYYRPYGKNRVFEIFGGYGYSDMHLEEGNSVNNFDYTIHKLYLQPAIGFRNTNIEGAFGLRFVAVSALELNAQNILSGTFLEPFAQFRAGGKRLKLELGAGLSFPVTPIDIQYVPAVVTIGLHYRFGGSIAN